MKVLLLLAIVGFSRAVDVDVKAASQYENYGCQCDSLTFKDKYGRTHGNCKRYIFLSLILKICLNSSVDIRTFLK